MGRDKALLPFRGRPMVEIAVGKLQSFCTAVSICGNRDDLANFAPVVHEDRLHQGPAAGIEAGLQACREPWAMFLPVDVPVIPAALLKLWATAVVDQGRSGCVASYLTNGDDEQPALCLLKRTVMPEILEAVEAGERKLRNLLWAVEAGSHAGYLWRWDVAELGAKLLDCEYPCSQLENWFRNVNTPDDLLFAEIGSGPE